MNRTRKPEDKWAQPGWRPEQRYSNKVLLGNWVEERLQFTREPQTAIVERRACWDVQPDATERRPAPLRAEGLPSKLLFARHGPPSSRYLVTHCEESYRRIPWHPNSSARLGRSERPISAALPTGSGRLPCTRRSHSEAPPSLHPSLSVYKSEYRRHPLSGLCRTRFARAPRALSSHLHAANHHNRDLELRGRPLLQVPDRCTSPPPRAQRAQRQQRGS